MKTLTKLIALGIFSISSSAYSTTISFSDLASFDNATNNKIVIDDFETPALGSGSYIQANTFNRHGILYDALGSNNVAIVGSGFSNFGLSGAIGTQVFTGNGEDDFSLDLSFSTQAIGFNTYLNNVTYNQGGAQIDIYGHSGLLGSFQHNHDSLQVGFFGVVSNEDITRIEWRSDYGYAINTGIDNVISASPVSAVPEPSTYAMMIGGLGLVGLMAARSKKA